MHAILIGVLAYVVVFHGVAMTYTCVRVSSWFGTFLHFTIGGFALACLLHYWGVQ